MAVLSTLSNTLVDSSVTLISTLGAFFTFSASFSFSLTLAKGFEGVKNGLVEINGVLSTWLDVFGTESKLVNGLFELNVSSEVMVKGSESGWVGDVLRVTMRCSNLPASLHEKCVTVTGVAHLFTSKSIKLTGGLSIGVEASKLPLEWSFDGVLPFKDKVNLSPP